MALEGHTYSEIAAELDYNSEYIKNRGAALMKSLSKQCDRKIRKNNLEQLRNMEKKIICM